jgi:hypothetical protein
MEQPMSMSFLGPITDSAFVRNPGNGTKRKALGWRVRGLVMARSYLAAERRFICNWCCARLTADQVVIDHFTPLAKGGSNDADNLVVACRECNAKKSDRDPETAEAIINEWVR